MNNYYKIYFIINNKYNKYNQSFGAHIILYPLVKHISNIY
jgi:hypothetical protein